MYKSTGNHETSGPNSQFRHSAPPSSPGGQGETTELDDDPGVFFGDTRHLRRDAKEFQGLLRAGCIPEDRVIHVMRRLPKLMERSADLGKVREFTALLRLWVHVARLGYRAKESGLALDECLNGNELAAYREVKVTRQDVLAVVLKLEELGHVKASDYPELAEAA